MAVKIRCTLCRQTFPWDISAGYPEKCPCCNQSIGHDRADDDIVMPSIAAARAATRATDQVYRDIESASEVRAQMAASDLGVPVSEVSDLKITDLRPTMKPGDIAAAPVNNAVSQFMAQNPGVGGFRGGQGAEYSGAVQSGPMPNAGARARTALHNHHAALTGGVASSDTPALEVLQPGYRRRG